MSKTPYTDKTIAENECPSYEYNTLDEGGVSEAMRKLENAFNEARMVLTEIAFGVRRPSKRGGQAQIAMRMCDMQYIASECLSKLSQEFPEPEINE